MKLNLNEEIVRIINSITRISLGDETVTDICFEASEETIEYETSFEGKNAGNWITITNPVKTQVIQIYTSQYFEEEESSKNNSLTIFLNLDSVALAYLTNSGFTDEGAILFMQVIADLKQKKQYLTYGRERIYTINPCRPEEIAKKYGY